MIIKDVSAAELEVMIRIWEADKPTTIKDVWQAIGENKWTYQTVQTFVNRLHMKGFIEIVGKRVKVLLDLRAIPPAPHLHPGMGRPIVAADEESSRFEHSTSPL